MKQLPSDSSARRPSPLASGLLLSSSARTLGILLLGIGLGAIGTSWVAPTADSSTASTNAGQANQTETPAESPLRALRFAQNLANRALALTNVSSTDVSSTDVSSATVCVKTRKGWDEQACAAGVSIDPQLAGIDPSQGAVVLTNYHVIADMGSRPPLQLGGKGETFNAEIIRLSPEFDLALLLVPRAQFPVAALAEASPAQGTAVRAIGFPNDQPLTIKDSSLLGITQNCLAVAPCLALQQGTITFGNSGGPLEANGKVVGLAQGEIEDELAIPVEQIRQFLSGQVPNSRPPQFPPGYPPSGYPPYSMEAPPYPPYPMEMEAPLYPAW